MWKKTVGAVLAVAIAAMLTCGAVAFGEALYWVPSTGWVNPDNTAQTGTFTAAEMATMTFYVRLDKQNPRDTVGTPGKGIPGTWYYLGESRSGVSFFPADNSLASLMRSYGFGGQTVKFSVSQAFKDTDDVEYDSSFSGAFSWIVPLESVFGPMFSPAPGNYAAAQSVALSSSTSGASIRYTTDGSTPSATVGTAYSVPVSVGVGTTTIKAIAYKSGMADSVVASAVYVVTLPFQPRTPAAPAGLGIR